jgi:ribonuclease HII
MRDQMKGRTWKGASNETASKVRQFLLAKGATEDTELKGASEVWRLRYEGSVFTYYESGSLYSSGGQSDKLAEVYERISDLVGQKLERPERLVLIGLDETGKGEVLGHSVLCVVKISRDVLSLIDKVLSTVDTKKRKSFAYWNSLFRELEVFKDRGTTYEIETIPPWDVDRYNVNKIMDVVYQRILSRILRGVEPEDCRIILDDYGIGRNLDEYLSMLVRAGAEVRVESRADEKYVEVRTAAVIAKWRQQLNMSKINEKFSLPGAPVGSGNAGDPATIKWLREWKRTGKEWPWFVKTSFSTVRELDGLKGKVQKADPPIRHELLSPDSRRLFREGRLSTSSLTIVCPSCGHNLHACKLTLAHTGELAGRCVSCNEVIRGLEATLRYYCGIVIPDSSVIIAGVISKDLDHKGFFDGFTILFHPLVRKETDTPGGKKELERIGDFSAMGRVAFRVIGGKEDVDKVEDDLILIESARDNDAILVTCDKGMYGNAVSQGVFCLTMKM